MITAAAAAATTTTTTTTVLFKLTCCNMYVSFNVVYHNGMNFTKITSVLVIFFIADKVMQSIEILYKSWDIPIPVVVNGMFSMVCNLCAPMGNSKMKVEWVLLTTTICKS